MWGTCSLLVLIAVCAVNAEDVVVSTEYGAVKGNVLKSRAGDDMYSFVGVPYAKPPVGPLAYQPPQETEPWEGEYDATFARPACLQMDLTNDYKLGGSADCLYLNIYTTSHPNKNAKKAVMVWIHGGAFMWGDGRPDNYGGQYLTDKDVVLVVIQYRLGSLGFLNTGDEVCPGNNGLKDQNMALRWIQENIEHFGGDPDRVTIFGGSAGGASVHYQYISPMSNGLFQRAISQSGTSLCGWSFVEHETSVKRTRRLAKLLGCPTKSSQEMIDCMRNDRTPEETVQKHMEFLEFGMDPITAFGPTVERSGKNRFLPEEPYKLLKAGKFSAVPLMIGSTTAEGAYGSAVVMPDPDLLKEMQQDYKRVFPITLDYSDTADDPDKISEKIREYYFGDKEIGEETLQNMTDMYGDRYFDHGIYEAFMMQLKHDKAPMYWYQFSHRGLFSISEAVGPDKERDYGVCHADELQYLFPSHHWPDAKEGEPLEMSEILTTLFTNFAKTGSPTPNNDFGLSWEPLSPKHMGYLNINLKPEMTTKYHFERMKFWINLGLRDSGKTGKESTKTEKHEEL